MRFNDSVWQHPGRSACVDEAPRCSEKDGSCVCVLRSPPQLAPPPAAPRDILIGYATGVPSHGILRLARALGHYAPSAHLALFVRKADQARLRQLLRDSNISDGAVSLLLGTDADISRGPSATWVEPAVDFDRFIRARSRMVDNVRRRRLNYVATVRYFHIRRFLEAHYTRFDRVIISDVRDIALQADPFRQIKSSRTVYAFTESTRYDSFGGNNFNAVVVRECYGESFLKRISHEKVVCCGVVMGNIDPILGYLSAFEEEFAKVGACGATDTAINVKVLYGHRNTAKWTARVQPSEIAETIHMALPEHWAGAYRIGADGIIYNKNSTPFALIHQPDRLARKERGWLDAYSQQWLAGTALERGSDASSRVR